MPRCGGLKHYDSTQRRWSETVKEKERESLSAQIDRALAEVRQLQAEIPRLLRDVRALTSTARKKAKAQVAS